MKSISIAVCGLLAAFISVQPGFGKDKARPDRQSKQVAVALHVRPPAPTPVRAVKPPPPDLPWVGRTVAISGLERHVIRSYVFDRVQASKGGRFNGVPQGLAKKIAFSNKLPTGWEKTCVPGKVLPAEVHKHCQPLPHAIVVKLPPPPPGTVLLAVDGKVFRVGYPTYEILDTFDAL